MNRSHARTFVLFVTCGGIAMAALDLARTPKSSRRAAARDMAELVVPPAQAAASQPKEGKPLLDTRAATARAAETTASRDAFPARSWVRPAAAPPPPPAPTETVAPPPAAPAVPFKYIGRLEQAGAKTLWYLAHGQQVHVVSVGETLAEVWRLDAFEAGQLQVTYIPMNIKQSLPIGAAK